MSHTEGKIIIRDSHGTTMIIDGKPYKQIGVVLSTNMDIKPDEASEYAARFVACWNAHNGLLHEIDNFVSDFRLLIQELEENHGQLDATTIEAMRETVAEYPEKS